MSEKSGVRVNLVIGDGHGRLLNELLSIESRQRGERLRTLAHLGLMYEESFAQRDGAGPHLDGVPSTTVPTTSDSRTSAEVRPLKTPAQVKEDEDLAADVALNLMKFQGAGGP